MRKRVLALILAAALLLSALPVQRAEAETITHADLEAIIAQQYDAYVKALKPEGASEGVSQLVKHSIKGGGTLHMDESDKFTKAMLSSEMLRASFIHATRVVAENMRDPKIEKIFMRGGLNWYEHKFSYSCFAYSDNENGNEKDDEKLFPTIAAGRSPYTGPINVYDEGLILVGGSTSGRYTYKRIATTGDSVSYLVTIKLMDRFDFNETDYKGDDTSLADTLTWMGRLLSLGLLTTFDWTAEASFQITVPNLCPHKPTDYRWEYDGIGELVSVADDSNTINSLTKESGHTEDDLFMNSYYALDSNIHLLHNRPWSLEFQCRGNGRLLFATLENHGGGSLYIVKKANDLYFGERIYLSEESETRTPVGYGIYFQDKKPISSTDTHVYRMSNRIFPDGSNMVYLYIDGEEIGPMDQYFLNTVWTKTPTQWVNGKDFVLGYFGNKTAPNNNIAIDYIQVWENGESSSDYDYIISKELDASCTDAGGNAQVCSLCDAVVSLADVKPALGHSFGPWKLTREATCGRGGQEKRTCATCGEAETRQLPKPEHSFPDAWELTQEATCKEAGEETKTCTGCGEMQTRALPVADHKYIPEVVAPTCYSQGYTQYTCTWCGSSYKDSIINALGHKPGTFVSDGNTTCTKDGTKSANCTRCDMKLTIQEEAYGHDYKNGTCSRCGEKDESYVPEAVLFAGSNMTLGNALNMNFFVNQTDIEGEENYAVITKHYADGRDDKVVKIPQSRWEKLGSTMYYFTFSGVTAKEMGDVFETVIYNAEGEAISEVRSDSIQDYARRMLDKAETKDKDKSLYVEMLNYGAAAQIKFGYDTENLVNSIITAQEQETYGIEARVYENQRQTADGYKGTSLTLESRILLNIVYEASFVTEGSYAIATFINHNGKEMEDRVDVFEPLGPYLYASFTKMSVADRSQLLTITLYDAEGNAIVTVQDTVEGYVARMTNSDPLYEAIMKFADAAYLYFHN